MAKNSRFVFQIGVHVKWKKKQKLYNVNEPEKVLLVKRSLMKNLSYTFDLEKYKKQIDLDLNKGQKDKKSDSL